MTDIQKNIDEAFAEFCQMTVRVEDAERAVSIKNKLRAAYYLLKNEEEAKAAEQKEEA